jgi:hypothetical protein
MTSLSLNVGNFITLSNLTKQIIYDGKNEP